MTKKLEDLAVPVYFMTPGKRLPKRGPYYVIAHDGVYFRKDTDLINALVKVDGVDFLRRVKTFATFDLPKISLEMILQTVVFFRLVYSLQKTEVTLMLFYNPETKHLVIDCPQQIVGWPYVKWYDSQMIYQDDHDYLCVGTIHSHGSLFPEHSDIDMLDTKNSDGLHIVIGDLDKPFVTFDCNVVVNGNYFHRDPTEVIDGLRPTEWKPRFVKKVGGKLIRVVSRTNRIYYALDAKPDLIKSVEMPGDWFSRVRKDKKRLRQLPTLPQVAGQVENSDLKGD